MSLATRTLSSVVSLFCDFANLLQSQVSLLLVQFFFSGNLSFGWKLKNLNLHKDLSAIISPNKKGAGKGWQYLK